MKRLSLVMTVAAALPLQALATTVFFEGFNYPDGSLTAVSSGGPNIWTNVSGTAGQMDVLNGVVNLTENESEDTAAGIPGGPWSTGTLYYSMIVNFSALPFGTGGGYFAHLKPSGTYFRARLFAAPNGSGGVRLGISNGSNTPQMLTTTDLVLGQSYRAMVRYDLAGAIATLWVNASSESDPSITGTDSVTAEPMLCMSLRQSKTTTVGMGTLTVDDVIVGTSFIDIVPEPTGILPLGLLALAAARKLRKNK